jgi:hypothetical protein
MKENIVKARTCYGHLGGELGNFLFKKLIDAEWLEPEENKKTVFKITEKGYEGFKKIGIDLDYRKD